MLKCPHCGFTKKFESFEAQYKNIIYELDGDDRITKKHYISCGYTLVYKCCECGMSGSRWVFIRPLRCPVCDNSHLIGRDEFGTEIHIDSDAQDPTWKNTRLSNFFLVKLECSNPACQYTGDVGNFMQSGDE